MVRVLMKALLLVDRLGPKLNAQVRDLQKHNFLPTTNQVVHELEASKVVGPDDADKPQVAAYYRSGFFRRETCNFVISHEAL